MQNLITEENYLKYLTHHGQSKDVASNVIEKWSNYKNIPQHQNNEAIRLWVEASAMYLKLNG